MPEQNLEISFDLSLKRIISFQPSISKTDNSIPDEKTFFEGLPPDNIICHQMMQRFLTSKSSEYHANIIIANDILNVYCFAYSLLWANVMEMAYSQYRKYKSNGFNKTISKLKVLKRGDEIHLELCV